MSRILLVLSFVCGCGVLCAQNLTAPLLSGSWQSTYHNPAMVHLLPGHLTIGLPGVSNSLRAENVTYNELFLTENGRRILDLARLPDLLEERNELRNALSIETIGVGLKGERWGATAYHRLRTYGEIDYPRTLIDVIARGNAQYIGQAVEIAPVGAASSYHELGLSLSYTVAEGLFLGGRIKYLSGVGDIRTSDNASLLLTTGAENFALTLDQDLTLRSAGVLTYDDLDDIDIDYDLNRLNADDLFNQNNGLAFDLGLVYEVDNLRLQASATDLGGNIEWANEVTELVFSGTDTFTGLDILQDVLEDSISFAGALDSLSAELSPVESNSPYRTNVEAAFYLGGEYAFSESLSGGALLAFYDHFLGSDPAIALTGRYQAIEWLQVGLNYNYRKGRSFNLGFHLFATPGPVQVFLATDNLLTLFSQKNNSNAGFRVGSAVVLGKQ